MRLAALCYPCQGGSILPAAQTIRTWRQRGMFFVCVKSRNLAWFRFFFFFNIFSISPLSPLGHMGMGSGLGGGQSSWAVRSLLGLVSTLNFVPD